MAHRWPGEFQTIEKTVTGAYRPVRGDFEGDGFDDVFFYGPGSRVDRMCFGTGGSLFESEAVTLSGRYRPVP